jgi:hypothetical protein
MAKSQANGIDKSNQVAFGMEARQPTREALDRDDRRDLWDSIAASTPHHYLRSAR